MRYIATWSFYPWLCGRGCFWNRISRMLAAAKASIELVERNYEKPIIYTDSLGEYIFSKITKKADFLVVYDDLTYIDQNLWAIAKILTYSKQTEPFFHFDLDFLCYKKFTGKVLDCEVLVQSYENLKDDNFLIQIEKHYNVPQLGHQYILPEIFNIQDVNSIMAPNMGCFMIKNMDLNKEYTDLALGIVKNNLEKFKEEEYIDMCVVEQQTLGLLMHNRNTLCHQLLPPRWDVYPGTNEFFHFCGSYYKRDERFEAQRELILAPWIDDNLMEVAAELHKILVNFRETQNNLTEHFKIKEVF